ncbi:EAL domain-containing protein [Marinobacterium arenosum]|uniref:EAL domain-containing protein n=1 Tax=Marinobacterium arenosum TaxID=2862496 RepID=UPI001C942F7D|nr:EAL domain-containing protein [Marinobacterium arenosum]MBY4678714.1 EAL domain-containing protein [Marinobacterium arenosum]
MRPLRFSTVILTLVLVLLAASSATLLTPAYLGSEKALQHQTMLAYERDQRALSSLLNAQFKNIQQISQELSSIQELRRALTANDTATLSRILSDLLASNSGQHIDAMVIEDKDGPIVPATNFSLLGLELPFESLSKQYSVLNNWTSTQVERDDNTYHLLRLTLPVVDEDTGEVMGELHSFVLLNNNYWIINNLQQLFGSQSISLSHDGEILDGLESEPGQLAQLRAPSLIPNGVLTAGSNILRDHYLRIGHSNYYSVRSLLPNSAYQSLQAAYTSDLGFAALIVMILGVTVLLAILYLIRSALLHLTRYAEQVPESGSPQAFSGGRFQEFIRVGTAVERMLLRIRDRDKRLASIIDNSPDLIFIKDLEHRYQLVNKRLASVLNLTPEQLSGSQPQDAIADHRLGALVQAQDSKVLSDIRPVQYEMTVSGPQGPSSYLVSKFPILDDQGQPYAIGGIATDITAIKQTQDQLQLAHQVFAETAEAIVVLDSQQRPLTSNRAFTDMSGFAEQDSGAAVRRFLASRPEILTQLSRTRRWQGECLLPRSDDSTLPVLTSATRLTADNGQYRDVLLLTDITELKSAEQRLERLALYDSLTGLPNRSLFYQRLEKALSDTLAPHFVAVMFIDLDRFKSINDTYGHNLGDQLLQQVSDRLRACLSVKDTVARLGGDEFTVVLREIETPDQVEQIAHRILAALHEPYDLGDIRCFSSGSIGIALSNRDGPDADTLTRNADLAMYQAKSQGRNVIQFFDRDMDALTQQRHHYEDGLHKALTNQELFVQYQPRFDIQGEQVLGAEALLRWRHSEYGLVAPDEFIPVAEESDLIVDIGRFVLLEACQQAAAWRQGGLDIPVAVNLSPRQLRDRNLLQDIKYSLEQSGLPPELLELEITENQVMENIDHYIHTLNQIRSMGVKLSVDDFGTGYSSLVYLKKLPIDTVKIDRSFIMDVPGDIDDENLIQAIIRMSHSLRLRVVAEGVETREQQQFLQALGCDEIQGFLLGRPGSVEQLKRLARQPEVKAG